MNEVDRLATFVEDASFSDLSESAVEQLKMRIADSLGCAFGALKGEPILAIREHLKDFDQSDLCSLIGGGKSSPDRAAFYNGALVRYLDFNDSYLAKGESCHPSDNLGSVLAACEYAEGSGKDLLLSLAVAYQVQCRLSDAAPVRARGFDHTTQGSYAAAAAVSKGLGMDAAKTAHAISIAGTAFNALRVTRTGALSHWKGLAYPNTGFCATHAAFLAMRGITGPPAVFEGNKGFKESIAGDFSIDWSEEDLERVTRTALKRFNAEVHSQSTLEGAMELRGRGLDPKHVKEIRIETFDVAYHIIGGGEEGDKKVVRVKEEADHSLPYMVAVALIDGAVTPAQYIPERIVKEDVQDLLKKVEVRPRRELSDRFPAFMPSIITVRLKNGSTMSVEKEDYQGYPTNPMKWEGIADKFHLLSREAVERTLREEILSAVRGLEGIDVKDLVALLNRPVA
jgi:2-methylcitrate dehydratase